VELLPTLPPLKSERFFPMLNAGLGLSAPPCVNEITKSFDSQDVLKYTQKKGGFLRQGNHSGMWELVQKRICSKIQSNVL